jgi:hypothetical protein
MTVHDSEVIMGHPPQRCEAPYFPLADLGESVATTGPLYSLSTWAMTSSIDKCPGNTPWPPRASMSHQDSAPPRHEMLIVSFRLRGQVAYPFHRPRFARAESCPAGGGFILTCLHAQVVDGNGCSMAGVVRIVQPYQVERCRSALPPLRSATGWSRGGELARWLERGPTPYPASPLPEDPA